MSQAGILLKAADNKKKWQKRWVELRKHLLVYSAKKGKPAEGQLDLYGVTQCKTGSEGKQKFVITLVTHQRGECGGVCCFVGLLMFCFFFVVVKRLVFWVCK